ncbi:MAG: cytochrome c biogenesis protein [Candidatus Bathyarchaeia archaeon]
MGIGNNVYLSITVVVNIIASYAAYVAAPPEATMGDLYRIFYIHTPSAWVCYLTLGISLLASILFLAKRKIVYDTLAEVSAILGLFYGVVALVTGSIWANAAWGVYWNWDPRETTTIILWIAYMGYISLRLSIGNVEKRALTSAVYNILAFSTIPLSYLSIRLWQSLHPLPVTGRLERGLSITPPMMETLLLNLIASSLVYIYLLRMAYDARSLQTRVDALTYEKGR